MKVKIFDENHEKDLEQSINDFIKTIKTIVDIKFQVAIMNDSRTNEQIYCYTALIIYQE